MTYSGEIEWRLAAAWANYKYETEFCELEGEEQSRIVAAYRIHLYGQAVIAYEQARALARSARFGRYK